MASRTLILVKPDGVRQNRAIEVLERIIGAGYTIARAELVDATPERLAEHYADLTDKPFFPEIVEYMTSGPVLAVIAQGDDVVAGFRTLAGATRPSQAAPGTIRADYGREYDDGRVENVVHGSDSPESAEREISLWFPDAA